MTNAKVTVRGGWIDVSHVGETLTLAAVGLPLQHLVKAQTSIPGRHKQLEDRARYRRLAAEAIHAVDPEADLGDVEVVWSWRNG